MASFLEFRQSREAAAFIQFLETRHNAGFVQAMPGIEIVNCQCIDPIDAETLKAVLVGAHDAIAGVVEPQVKGQTSFPALQPA